MSQQVKKITSGIISYLRATKKLHLLPEITKQLEQKMKFINAQSNAVVLSSYRLSNKEVGQIKEALELIFKKKLTVINRVDPSLIAGFKITVSDKIIDLSIDKTLQNLKDELSYD